MVIMSDVGDRILNTRPIGAPRPRQSGTDVPSLYAAQVMSSNVSSDNDTSSGGTPWVGRIGSRGGNRRGQIVHGLNPGRSRDDPRPFSGPAMVNRKSQSLRVLAPNETLDDLNTKNKSGWWHHGNEILPVNIGNWSASGPERPTLHLRTFSWRKGSQGNRNTGMHTNIAFSPRTLPGRESMVARSQNRLTVARYRGQSFSATTQVLGG